MSGPSRDDPDAEDFDDLDREVQSMSEQARREFVDSHDGPPLVAIRQPEACRLSN